jgi:hypothetical protein
MRNSEQQTGGTGVLCEFAGISEEDYGLRVKINRFHLTKFEAKE